MEFAPGITIIDQSFADEDLSGIDLSDMTL